MLRYAWLCYIKKTNITIKIKEQQGAEDIYLSEPKKTHPIDEFVIVAKFGGHVLRHLASRLVNMIRQAGRQTKNLVLVIFCKVHILSFYMFYALYLALVTLKRYFSSCKMGGNLGAHVILGAIPT